MADILWLDDDVRGDFEIRSSISALRSEGHVVRTVESEEEALERLISGLIPDVFIQDLYRPGAEPQTFVDQFRNLELQGWDFYVANLKRNYPEIPVIICSRAAEGDINIQKADDFNLTLLTKHARLDLEINGYIQALLKNQRRLIESNSAPPAIVKLDFSRVNVRLIEHLSRNPVDIHQVNWSTFEALVETLLRELGYDVFRTPLTRDGGVDLWAISKNEMGEILYAIDAKKYSPSRLVGPEPVRAIHGVAHMSNANVGMIVTTSRFGPHAVALANQHRFLISLKDFDDLASWISLVANRRQ